MVGCNDMKMGQVYVCGECGVELKVVNECKECGTTSSSCGCEESRVPLNAAASLWSRKNERKIGETKNATGDLTMTRMESRSDVEESVEIPRGCPPSL